MLTHPLSLSLFLLQPFLTMRRQELFRSAQGLFTREDEMERAESHYINEKVIGDNFFAGHTKAFAR